MILFRYAWIVALVAIGGSWLGSCASSKAYPETWGNARLIRPAWLQQPAVALDVRWIREAVAAARVVDGVCEVQFPDTPAAVETNLGDRQVQACVAAGGLRTDRATPAGAVRLHWHRARGAAGIRAMWNELFTTASWPLAGFYFHPDRQGPCHVITRDDRAVLGHELKHCFDGGFHGQEGGR